jgi:hypothetical protein
MNRIRNMIGGAMIVAAPLGLIGGTIVSASAASAPAAVQQVAPRHGICDAGWLCHPTFTRTEGSNSGQTGPNVYYHADPGVYYHAGPCFCFHSGTRTWVLADGSDVYYHA